MRYIVSTFLLFVSVSCGGGGGSENSGGISSNPGNTADNWLIDANFVKDGGPGKDGIPSIDNPSYVTAANANFVSDSETIIGTKINGIVRTYPHSILNWHEIVNVESDGEFHALSYCPLTGTSTLWTVPNNFVNKTFGVSGLLYNSNLIPYDRETDSNWAQMLSQSVNGTLSGTFIDENAVIETTWGNWKLMYPETVVLSEVTGFSRDYNAYPYGSYLTDSNLLFDVANEDPRLHEKTRALGINNHGVNKVYVVSEFNQGIEVINENTGNSPYVVIGSSEFTFAIAFSSTLADGTELTFTAVDSSLPIIMQDNEGNEWDILGTAVSGARIGQKLMLESDFIAFWFAWVAMHPNPEIHTF